MSVDIALRDLPESLVERLQRRAASHHRSLEGEIVALLEEALSETVRRVEDALAVIGTLDEESAERLEESMRESRSRWR